MVTKHAALVDYENSLLYLGGNLVINTSTRGPKEESKEKKKIFSTYSELHGRLNFLFVICIHLVTLFFCKLKIY